MNFFSVKAVTDWNALPNDIVEANSMVNFKKCLDTPWANYMHNIV